MVESIVSPYSILKMDHTKMSEIRELIGKMLGYWALSGIITTTLYYIVIWATGNLGDIISSAIINRVLDSLNPLFALIVGWTIDPLSIIVQFIIFVIILVAFSDEISSDLNFKI